MVLRAQLYNPPEELQEALQCLGEFPWSACGSGDRSPIRRSERTLEVRRQLRLTESEIQDLIRDYQSGETIKALSARHGIHRTTVSAHLERNNIPKHQRGLTRDQVRQAGKLYEQGDSLATIGERFGVDAQTVRDRIADTGVKIRKRRGW